MSKTLMIVVMTHYETLPKPVMDAYEEFIRQVHEHGGGDFSGIYPSTMDEMRAISKSLNELSSAESTFDARFLNIATEAMRLDPVNSWLGHIIHCMRAGMTVPHQPTCVSQEQWDALLVSAQEIHGQLGDLAAPLTESQQAEHLAYQELLRQTVG